MKLIDADKLNFHCNYNGDCSGDISHCKECDNYILDYRDVQEQPTIYDTDKVVERLEETKAYMLYENMNADVKWIDKAIDIVKAGE